MMTLLKFKLKLTNYSSSVTIEKVIYCYGISPFFFHFERKVVEVCIYRVIAATMFTSIVLIVAGIFACY